MGRDFGLPVSNREVSLMRALAYLLPALFFLSAALRRVKLSRATRSEASIALDNEGKALSWRKSRTASHVCREVFSPLSTAPRALASGAL